MARLAVESGAQAVAITGRDAARGAAVLADLGHRALFVQADLADPDAPAAIAARVIASFGRIDALVNAAGLTDRGDVLNADLDLWAKLMAVTARAPFFLMQAAIRDMRGRNAPGAIVNILSMNGHGGAPDLAVYSATKGALATLTRNAANAHLAHRIRVNGIMMDWAVTPGELAMQGQVLGKGTGWAEEVARTMPLGRLLTADEVARQVVGFAELTLETRQTAATTKAFFTFYLAAGVPYLAVTLTLGLLFGRIERWTRRGEPSLRASG